MALHTWEIGPERALYPRGHWRTGITFTVKGWQLQTDVLSSRILLGILWRFIGKAAVASTKLSESPLPPFEDTWTTGLSDWLSWAGMRKG